MGRRRRNRIPQEPLEAVVTGLSHEGRGIVPVDGKTVFVHGALPGERVIFRYTRTHRRFDEGVAIEILDAAPDRVAPACAAYSVCGGCSLQHMQSERQIAFKESVLLELFQRFGEVAPETVLPPLRDAVWGYRRKARLAVKQVPGKGRVLVGFRERGSPFVADMRACEVLDPRVGHRLEELSALVGGLGIADRIPQIEVAIGDEDVTLVFRNLSPPGAQDLQELAAWGRTRGIQIYLQPGNESTITPVWPESPELTYSTGDVRLHFLPTDFTQVNAGINRQMLARAMELLAPRPEDRILDLFCGIGNFSLPLARCAGEVAGVEGEESLVRRARENATLNCIGNAAFHVADLSKPVDHLPWARSAFSKVLLDPPRTGAADILPQVADLGAKRILYISCNPATLARDAGALVHDHGYLLRQAGVMDMFPHTAHVESIALFERQA